MRLAAAALGAGAAVFGVVPVIAPRAFARLFGLGQVAPGAATAIRSVGVRDLVTGAALLRAAWFEDEAILRQWLVARVACDAGDTVMVALAVAAGERNPRLLALGGLAFGAAAYGALVARWAGSFGARVARRAG